MRQNTQIKKQFKDAQIINLMDIFFSKTRKGSVYQGRFDYDQVDAVIDLIPQTINKNDITWGFFQSLYDKSNSQQMKEIACRLVSEFIKNDCYYGEHPEVVDTFKMVGFGDLGKVLEWVFSKSLSPHNIVVHKRLTKQKGETTEKISCYPNDCKNFFLSQLLREFVTEHENTTKHNFDFYKRFQESLDGMIIKNLTDFNANTFKQQYYFYKSLPENKHNHLLTVLKRFYLKLLSHPEGENILHWKNGIDKNMLSLQSFNENFEAGFLPIPLNQFDPVPEFDKWLVMPNGNEKKSTKINSFSYKPIDFSLCQDEVLKNGVKHWFWNSTVVLTARIDQAYVIIKFINYIYDLRNKFSIKKFTSPNVEPDTLTVEEVFSYVQLVKANNKNRHLVSVRSFLTFLSENNLYHVEPGAFKWLSVKRTTQENTAKDISDEKLIKIEAKIKEKANKGYIYMLYYILFHIAIATEFRISQIINLKVDCLVKGAKKEYYLESNSKVSNGKKVKIPITPYTRRYIETAIRFTQKVRDNCNDASIEEHIFIHEYSNLTFKVISSRSFSDYLRNTCLELGIEGFTAQNLRDTYMTKSLEYAIKNGLSDLELKALTAHKRIDTTTNHYVAQKINDYLEATHMVVIGNPSIKGNIVAETDKRKEDLVNDQCGYCPYESCIKKDDNLDCLMCSGFIATIDRIPYYEEKIRNIDNDIKSTTLSTEKERLITIKRLYLAYLRKLLELKEKNAV